MQTFLPFKDFYETAKVLDYRRLGKQRIETKQIYQTLTGISNGWKNHPCIKMWKGCEYALLEYGYIICKEWVSRGYKDSQTSYFEFELMHCKKGGMPIWMGDINFHLSHQSNLVRKDNNFYGKLFPNVQNDLPYIWPN